MKNINIEKLIPHRDRMKLIDEIIDVDEETAVTGSIVSAEWPLFEEDSVSSIILIELVAQTAGVCIGWKELKKGGDNAGGSGWLVGIKEAVFFLDRIPLNSRIIISSKNSLDFGNYHEVLGVARIGSKIVGQIRLQVVQSDSN